MFHRLLTCLSILGVVCWLSGAGCGDGMTNVSGVMVSDRMYDIAMGGDGNGIYASEAQFEIANDLVEAGKTDAARPWIMKALDAGGQLEAGKDSDRAALLLIDNYADGAEIIYKMLCEGKEFGPGLKQPESSSAIAKHVSRKLYDRQEWSKAAEVLTSFTSDKYAMEMISDIYKEHKKDTEFSPAVVDKAEYQELKVARKEQQEAAADRAKAADQAYWAAHPKEYRERQILQLRRDAEDADESAAVETKPAVAYGDRLRAKKLRRQAEDLELLNRNGQ
jgi:hypothetical protein